MAKNLYHGLKTATHPCYDLQKGGYTCSCGKRSRNKKTHNNHVVEAHTKEEAEVLLAWFDFDKLYGGVK